MRRRKKGTSNFYFYNVSNAPGTNLSPIGKRGKDRGGTRTGREKKMSYPIKNRRKPWGPGLSFQTG